MDSPNSVIKTNINHKFSVITSNNTKISMEISIIVKKPISFTQNSPVVNPQKYPLKRGPKEKID